VTTFTNLRSRESCARRLNREREREREPDELDQLMRQPRSLATPDEPVPLHRTGRDTAERTTVSRPRPGISRTRSPAC
jgi:hypothetical protein